MSNFLTGLGALGGMLPGIGPAITGFTQMEKSNAINPIRPDYTIPSNIGDNVAMYQNMADSSRMPGYGYAQNNINQNQASLVRQALQSGGSAGDILASLGGISQNTNNSLNQLAQQGAQYQAQAKQGLAQANDTMADYKNQAFDYNQNQPYEQQYMRKMALQGAAFGNYDTAAQQNSQLAQSAMSAFGKMGA